MKRVLFIAYHFPPLAGGGTFRSLKFVKYLPEFGWLPTVITTNTKLSWAYNASLLDEIPDGVKIIRASEIDPFYLHIILSKIGLGKLYDIIKRKFFIPDEKIGWIPLAYLKAKKELKKHKYDLIYSTSPTISSHIIAQKLSKKTNIPWVCDFRDFWTMHPYYKFSNTKRGNKEKIIEKKILDSANLVISAFNKIKFRWKEIFPEIITDKFHTIYNGFDTNFQKRHKPMNNKLNILYTGSFYGKYNPNIFFKALSDIYKANPDFKNYVNLKFVGNIEKEIKQQTNVNVEYFPFMAHDKLNEFIQNCDILLLILPIESQLPGKIFSYMIAQKPILAIIPNGEAKTILQKANLGYFANPDSPEDIKNQILNIYNLWKENKLNPKPNIEYIKQFHRLNLTKQLAEIFDSIV